MTTPAPHTPVGPAVVGDLVLPDGSTRRIHRLAGTAPDDLPRTLRIVLENLLQHADDERVTAAQVQALRDWGTPQARAEAVELFPARAFLHDTNGVPALVDLAAMRDAVRDAGGDASRVNPRVPSDLVVDHSVIVDVFGRPDALPLNVEREYERNLERYRFLRWGQSTLDRFTVVPPGTGIMHQVNVEFLAAVVVDDGEELHPDICLGTDSHTTMVNGLGVLAWGIGGIEAEAVMLGETISMLPPPVVGVRLQGALRPGVTATDLVLTITERLRRHGVVGKFVEFHGPGLENLPVSDRVTISNMAPEYGATCGWFPVDAETIRYLRFTGRSDAHADAVEVYAREQGLWADDRPIRYSEDLVVDLTDVEPSLAGPRRPQDRVPLQDARSSLHAALEEFGTPPRTGPVTVGLAGGPAGLRDGAVAIAAITSCTNTSNPAVMVAAGLLARNAVRAGLRTKPWVKTSMSPGSRVVTRYLDDAGLTPALETLGFHLTGYGCMTCIGASGPLIPEVSAAVAEHDLAVASVLSGNRNFDGRINPDVRMNYLASPPLVVAFALAGTVDVDLTREPLGTGADGRPVHLADLWPDRAEIEAVTTASLRPQMFTEVYRDVFTGDERWRGLDVAADSLFAWDPGSTYVRRPPYFDGFTVEPPPVTDIVDARVLVKLGDSVTTDHIAPAGAIPRRSEAAAHLLAAGVDPRDLNTYASRRGNHEVMVRGCFANVRLRNQLVPGVEGGFTYDFTCGRTATVHAAAQNYRAQGVPSIVLAGREYGTGSSRDWAAKGPALLGVRAVLAESFERIHRTNLVGMGVLPLQFLPGQDAASLGLTGTERFTVRGLSAVGDGERPGTVTVTADDREFEVLLRLDTPREADYVRHGGIHRYVLRRLLAAG
ncbi:aconitate hydratase AcnA [Kineococcus sp. SYSU DK002]|uniref:aconitate hydratase AcnA n=1 Tax=Kineococcus sp. SYSU DK002 TaxID=3383123 RepID=UPI003D7E0693